MPQYLQTLNPAQLEAVNHGTGQPHLVAGPLLIIAGAGSGKTNTLACRVANLIKSGADPQKILLLTFTRRAAEEMIRRASKMIAESKICGEKDAGTGSSAPLKITWAGTFHSIANRLLRMYADPIGIDPAFTVVDRSDSSDIINKIRSDLGLTKKETRFPKKDTCLEIYSFVVNAQCGIDEALETHFPWCKMWEQELRSLFKKYAERKKEMNVMDFDDLLLYLYFAAKEKNIADSISRRFDHILVDEYQDTNKLQAELLHSLKPDGRGICVVGDDAQSIYSFRAATVKNILEFPQQFSQDARCVTLDKNYRSTMPILTASNAVIGQAANRFTKSLYSDRFSEEKPFLVTAEDEAYQAEYIASKVLEYREAGINLKDQAVLFRSSHHSALLEIELGKRGIPFVKYGGLKFLDAAHIKDVIAVLRWVENPKDVIAAFRVLQLLEGVGPGSASKAIDFLSENSYDLSKLSRFVPPSAAKKPMADLCHLLSALNNAVAPWAGQPEQVCRWYQPHFERMYDANPSREKDLEQLVQMAGQFPCREKFLSDFVLNPPEITSDEAGKPLLDEDYLILSTIHSAKGQEWKTVYILNVADGWIPSDMATENEEQIDEERRLLYVAMTRAKDHLHLTYPSRFYTYGFKHRYGDRNMYAIRSRFIPDDILDLFQRDVFGRSSNDAVEKRIEGESMCVADKVSSFWNN